MSSISSTPPPILHPQPIRHPDVRRALQNISPLQPQRSLTPISHSEQTVSAEKRDLAQRAISLLSPIAFSILKNRRSNSSSPSISTMSPWLPELTLQKYGLVDSTGRITPAALAALEATPDFRPISKSPVYPGNTPLEPTSASRTSVFFS